MYAGVILSATSLAIPLKRVPRVCGGDPIFAWYRRSRPVCSPCMRGWSYILSDLLSARSVFPVYAGVIPKRAWKPPKSTGVPRVCGGDPFEKMFTGHTENVFPVYAGVILIHNFNNIITNRVPRVCGGDPSLKWIIVHPVRCSPCMRGWSFVVCRLTNH